MLFLLFVFFLVRWYFHSLDIIGLAGFSHDFGALDGKPNSITAIFDSFSTAPNASMTYAALSLLAQTFPILMDVPTTRTKLLRKMNSVMKEISNNLLVRTKNELEKGEGEKSIIGFMSTFLFLKRDSKPLTCSDQSKARAPSLTPTCRMKRFSHRYSETQNTRESFLTSLQMNTLLILGYETVSSE